MKCKNGQCEQLINENGEEKTKTFDMNDIDSVSDTKSSEKLDIEDMFNELPFDFEDSNDNLNGYLMDDLFNEVNQKNQSTNSKNTDKPETLNSYFSSSMKCKNGQCEQLINENGEEKTKTFDMNDIDSVSDTKSSEKLDIEDMFNEL